MKVGEILKKFETWLKEKRKMTGKPGSSKKRRAILETASKLLYSIEKKDPEILKDIEGLIDRAKDLSLSTLNKEERKHIDLLVSYLNEELAKKQQFIDDEIPPELLSDDGTMRRAIGKITITTKSPATPFEFSFWVEDVENLHVEVGTIITAIDVRNRNKIIGLVDEIKSTSTIDDPIEDFYAMGFGDPTVESPTRRPIIRVASASIIKRLDDRAEPPCSSLPIYYATKDEIMDAYGSDIPEEKRILCGFTWDENKNPVPIYLHSDYLLGYESAHVNIAGASGLATKTSYALFLITSILSSSLNDSIAVVAFNVKEADLMRIDQGPSTWDNLFSRIDDEKNLKLWKACQDEDINPFILQENVKFFAPPRPTNTRQGLTFRAGDYDIYSYGLYDIINISSTTLLSLLDPSDINEKTSGLLFAIREALLDLRDRTLDPKPRSFLDLLNVLSRLSSGRERWVDIGTSSHHTSTISMVVNRLTTAVRHQLRGLLVQEGASGKPIPVFNLKEKNLWVIDISKLHPKGQRLVFSIVYNTLALLLEAKRNNEDEIQLGDRTVSLADFPNKIVVFVDELNKFAPSGREFSPIKSSIVDITARGRSIGLSLIGAQQMASQVDSEILANTSTFAVGRSHAIGLKGGVFEWLKGGLKDKALVLKKGDMILWHAVHNRPVIISFPKPIHYL